MGIGFLRRSEGCRPCAVDDALAPRQHRPEFRSPQIGEAVRGQAQAGSSGRRWQQNGQVNLAWD